MEGLNENCPFESFGRIPGKQRQAISFSFCVSLFSKSLYYTNRFLIILGFSMSPAFPCRLSAASLLLLCLRIPRCAPVLAFLCFFRLVPCRSLSGTKLCRVQSRIAHVPSQVSPAGGRINWDKAQRPSPPFNPGAVDFGLCSVCATFWTWRPSYLAMKVHRGRLQWLPPPLRLLRRRQP